jgi:hypothetical protein
MRADKHAYRQHLCRLFFLLCQVLNCPGLGPRHAVHYTRDCMSVEDSLYWWTKESVVCEANCFKSVGTALSSAAPKAHQNIDLNSVGDC